MRQWVVDLLLTRVSSDTRNKMKGDLELAEQIAQENQEIAKELK